MSNLENSIKDCITNEIEKGIIEKVIADQLEKCIEKSVSDMFSWGGEVKKVVEEKIKSVMIPYLESYDYSQYIVKLDSVLTDVLKATALENKTILTNFKELITETLKGVKMSDILEEWAKHCERNVDKDKIDMDYEGGYVTATLDTEEVSSSWSDFQRVIVRLECDEDEELKCEFEISKWEGRRENFTMDKKALHEISSLRNLSEFDVFLLKVSQGYNNIILDIENDSLEKFIEYEE